MDKWVGKVAVVTGASAGIGSAIVEALANEGITVVGLARRKERVEEIANKNKSAKGKIHAVECDVTSSESISKAFDWIENTLGGVDILVNNAGLVKVAHIFDLNKPESDYTVTIDTNFTGLVLVTRRAFKTMREKSTGFIININSVAGQNTAGEFQANNGFNVYAPTKHAVTQLGKVMKLEIANAKKNIRLTSISPGMVKTEIAGDMVVASGGSIYDRLPHLLPSDIADQVVYLLGTKPNVNITELTLEPMGQKVVDFNLKK